MKTIKVYEKKDWDNFGKNTPEHYSDWSSTFLQRYKHEIKPSTIDEPANQLALTYLVNSLSPTELRVLRTIFHNTEESLKKEETELLEKLKNNRNTQKHYKFQKSRISKCQTFKEAFEELISEIK